MESTITEPRKEKKYRLIGVDGEGYFNTEEKRGGHKYDVFSAGKTTITNRGRHLSIHKIVEIIKRKTFEAIERGETPIFIGFFFNYDFTQMIRTLHAYELERLYNRSARTKHLERNKNQHKYEKPSQPAIAVDVDNGDKFSKYRFKMDYLESKSITFKFPEPKSLAKAKLASDESKIKWVSAKIQDVGTIFGSSFIKAMDDFKIPMSCAEKRMLHDGKAGRAISETTAERIKNVDEIVRYNRVEISLIYRLIARLISTLHEVGVDVDIENDLSGIGSLAGKYLKTKAGNTLAKSWDIADILSPEVYQFVNDTYFGGWAETLRPGLHDGMYQMDITSAYPDAMRNLPDLTDALTSQMNSIKQCNEASDAGSIVFADITFKTSQRFCGALPFRTLKNSVLRPEKGRGRYYWKEVQAAVTAGLLKETDIIFHEGYAITPTSKVKPFKYVEEMYFGRLSVGKKTVKGAVIKVLMNSQYGKVAQSIGNPVYANPVYASMITAAARIKLMEAIGTHPDGLSALLATATDAVFFSTPHTGMSQTLTESSQAMFTKSVDESRVREEKGQTLYTAPGKKTLQPSMLGEWETDYYKKAFLLKPGIWGGVSGDSQVDDWSVKTDWRGIYELDEHDSWSVKTRGISKHALVARLYDTIIPQLQDYHSTKTWDESWSFKTENTFSMLSLGEAINRNKTNQVGEFMVGDHGTPELVRSVSTNLFPKRHNVRYSESVKGFTSSVPWVVSPDGSIPRSHRSKTLIGSVQFDEIVYRSKNSQPRETEEEKQERVFGTMD